LTSIEDDRIRGLITEGRELLEAGRGGEAADIFGRVLLHHPDDADARRGLEAARAATTEAQRLLDERLDAATRAVAAGASADARRLLEVVVQQGGDRDRALALLDRLDPRSGRLESALSASEGPAAAPARAASSGTHSRRAFAVVCVTSFACLAAGVSSTWERLVDGLARTPSPASEVGPSSTFLAAPTGGERAISDARRLIERGDNAGALSVLDRVTPDEPAYPFARQLREQILGSPAAGARR
jgi:hypothetical protein